MSAAGDTLGIRLGMIRGFMDIVRGGRIIGLIVMASLGAGVGAGIVFGMTRGIMLRLGAGLDIGDIIIISIIPAAIMRMGVLHFGITGGMREA